MKGTEIKIEFYKKQIVNDVGIECNLVGKNLQSTAIQGMDNDTIAAGIMAPDDDEVKPVVARSMTEAWDEVKKTCQRYLVYGRESDDNRLEKINEMAKTTENVLANSSGQTGNIELVKDTEYEIRVVSSQPVTVKFATTDAEIGVLNNSNDVIKYTPSQNGKLKFVVSENEAIEVTYWSGPFGSYELILAMPPSFNTGMTSVIKSTAHRVMVDYVMSKILANQFPEKATSYYNSFDANNQKLLSVLNSRVKYTRRTHDWS